MPNFTYDDNTFQFSYDDAQSTIENRSVTNHHNILHSFQSTIIFTSGTANLSIYVNNDRYWERFAQTSYAAMMNPDHYADIANQNVQNASFSAHWVDITSSPKVTIVNNIAYVDAPFRFIRLQGIAATGSVIAHICTSNSEQGL